LAEWIASPQNPLTARVMVNRLWQHHFGDGIVKTTTDFGHAGLPPTHPKLLDWLAAELVEPATPLAHQASDTTRGDSTIQRFNDSTSPWSLKHLHRLILLSSAYRMSSVSHNDRAEKIDPANDLLWRQNLRRLEAEAIRDS